MNNIIKNITKKQIQMSGLVMASFLLMAIHLKRRKCKYSTNLNGKLVLVTGCNTGIGE